MRLPEGPWYRASGTPGTSSTKASKSSSRRGRRTRAALEAFHRLMAMGPGGLPKHQEITVAHVCDLFLTEVCPYAGDPPKKEPKANDPLREAQRHARGADLLVAPRFFLESFCGQKRVGHLKASA